MNSLILYHIKTGDIPCCCLDESEEQMMQQCEARNVGVSNKDEGFVVIKIDGDWRDYTERRLIKYCRNYCKRIKKSERGAGR